MYNTLAISTHVCQIFNILWEVNFHQIFMKYAIPTHFKFFENIIIIVQKHWTFGTLVARGMIKCILQLTKMFSNTHMMFLTAFLAKPMFKVNKPLFILEQTMDLTWQNIPWLVKEYFATSLNNIHMENEYINNIPWHNMEYVVRLFSCSPNQAHLLMLAC